MKISNIKEHLLMSRVRILATNTEDHQAFSSNTIFLKTSDMEYYQCLGF